MLKVKFDSKNFKDSMYEAMARGVESSIKETVKPFENEIRKSGGRVTVTVPKDLKNVKISFENVSDDIVDRINKAFR